MTDYRDQATFHRAALMLGLTSGEFVIAWADTIISTDPAPPPAISEVSLVPPGDLTALRAALQPLAARTESNAVLRAVIGIAARDLARGGRSVKDTVTVLSQVRRGLTIPDAMQWAIDTIEDDHMLATGGVTNDLDAVEARVRAWLAAFEDVKPIPSAR